MKAGDTVLIRRPSRAAYKVIRYISEMPDGTYIVFTDGTNYKSWTDGPLEIEVVEYDL